VLNIKAQAQFYSGDVDSALELISATVDEDPGFAWSFNALSIIYLSQGDFAGYLEIYARLGDLIGVPPNRADLP
jgi:tetratricopeptide (TPR) repeat protein